MTDSNFPFTHLVPVVHLNPEGLQITIEPTEQQRTNIAEMLSLPSIEKLEGSFTLTPRKKGFVNVRGSVKGAVHQTCVVTLDSFPTNIDQSVEVEFSSTDANKLLLNPVLSEDMEDIDPPDLIIDGQIDLGLVTVEFLALALPPFPRKPDAVFDYKDPTDEKENPFAALTTLMQK